MFQNIALLFLPWLVTTVLATGVEAGIDGWILYRVNNDYAWGLNIKSSFQASFTPVTAFIFTFEFFFLLLQVFVSDSVSKTSYYVQVYTVYCTVQLYTLTGLARQGGGRELQFIKVCVYYRKH